MEKRAINYLAVLLILFSSCSLNRNSNDSLDYNEDAGMYVKKIGEYTFTLRPYSSDRLAATNYDASTPTLLKDSILKEYNNFACFILEIDIDGFSAEISEYDAPGVANNYTKKLNYYLFNMQNDLKLKEADGTEMPCTVYYHERMNEVCRTNRFIIGFPKPQNTKVILEYFNPYLSCGKINFSINENHLAQK